MKTDKFNIQIKALLLFCTFFLVNIVVGQNPMGKTWIVFVENSNYETFASLEGPSKDVSMMSKALKGYAIDRYIYKKDMSQKQMEDFFSGELESQIRANGVKSLIIWYAGHGKFINETSYWIPVDAVRDDEFTYFNISSLKDAMDKYKNNIAHTLVITDACETGPSFYQAMRSFKKAKCNDPQANRFKSAQVLSSSGYELASDNSQFTKAFAKTLEVNAGSCIAIEDVVSSVSQAVKDNKQKQPRFGKIPGMGEQKGTFFFMKK